MSKTYIYSRVSTDKQQTENQLHRLRELYPVAIIVEETVSGYKDKPALNALLAQLERGDVLVVAALDRLGRHARKALALIEDLSTNGIKVVSIREGIDTATASGKFVATCMFGLAEMERNLISERTKAAMAAKKVQGQKFGRPNVIPDSVKAQIQELRQQGKIIKEIAKITGVSTGRVCQLVNKSA